MIVLMLDISCCDGKQGYVFNPFSMFGGLSTTTTTKSTTSTTPTSVNLATTSTSSTTSSSSMSTSSPWSTRQKIGLGFGIASLILGLIAIAASLFLRYQSRRHVDRMSPPVLPPPLPQDEISAGPETRIYTRI